MELKFRGQKRTDSQWLYFDLNQDCENDDEESNPFLEYILKNVTQNTGLKDKNGNELYKGDVFKVKKCIGEIIFIDGRFDIKWHKNSEGYNDTLKYHYESIEKIGNIFDNPELLQ